jgi:hypothetical protein
MDYQRFIDKKRDKVEKRGFKALWIPDFLFDFQKELVDWAITKGQAALFEDCGLGKTPQQLVWSQNILQKTNKNILIVTPLAVSYQTVREAEKFNLSACRTKGKITKGINVTNYEQLKNFNPKDFIGVVLDESSILKNFNGKMRKQITEFVAKIKFRLLCSATPSPNDYMELGTSSEALNYLTHNQMLAMFFTHSGTTTSRWLIKGHAKSRFWQWVSLWSRAIRKPSDLGYEDNDFKLPELKLKQHYINSDYHKDVNMLISLPAVTLNEQRNECKRTTESRCQKAMEITPKKRPYLIWCHLNREGNYLEKNFKDVVQVSGSDKDSDKEQKLIDFTKGNIRILVTKPRIAGFGLNWQHCSDMVFFPSHSYEQFYQCIRRCWRFGQKRKVNLNIVASEREKLVVDNMIRKERLVNEMYNGIIREMGEFQRHTKKKVKTQKVRIPKWL